MTLYRQHRGTLADSMATVRQISSIDDIAKIERDQFTGTITIKPYGHDARIGWNTYIVTAEGYGVLGFTDGPLEA